MSPRELAQRSPRIESELRRVTVAFGIQVREARRARGWNVRELARRAALSADMVYRIESGQGASVDAVVRLALALGREPAVTLVDPRRRHARPNLSADSVHSAMGEFEAGHLAPLGIKVGLDEPYQHYQFAGRADLIAWDTDARALLHIENRTRFPDFQEMAGAFNAKRAYLASALADRVGVFGWRSETHVIVALWSSEVLHALRLRSASFRALCPDAAQTFDGWWQGKPPKAGAASTLVVLDPLADGRQRAWISLDEALTARPRYRGYADAAAKLATNGATAAASSLG